MLTALTEANAQNIIDSVVYTVDKAIPAYVYMQEPQVNNHAAQTKAKYSEASQVLRDVLGLNAETTAALTDTMSDFANGFHQFYAEYYKGVKVEDTRCTIHYKNGAMSGMTGNFRTISSLDVVPGISQDNALTAALKNVGAER